MLYLLLKCHLQILFPINISMATTFNSEVVALSLHGDRSSLPTSQHCACGGHLCCCVCFQKPWSSGAASPPCTALMPLFCPGHRQQVGPGKAELKTIHYLVMKDLHWLQHRAKHKYLRNALSSIRMLEHNAHGIYIGKAGGGRRNCCISKPSLAPCPAVDDDYWWV